MIRFRFTELGAQMLGLSADVTEREFTGFSTVNGLMGGVPVGLQRWAERELRRIGYDNPVPAQMDVMEARLLFYVLAIRGADHMLLPIDRFPDLATAYFDIVPHQMTTFDRDGDCGECNAAPEAGWHLPGPDVTELPPTPAGADPATTGTP